MLLDDEIFKKITIWIPELKEGTYPFAEGKIVAYFTKGGSAWPETSCGGVILNGILEIYEVTNGAAKIRISSNVNCTHKNGRGQQQVEIDETYKLSNLDFEDISPWIGKKGDHVYRETYREK